MDSLLDLVEEENDQVKEGGGREGKISNRGFADGECK